MDLRTYYFQAAEAAAPSVHADDDVVEVTPKAVPLKLQQVQAGMVVGYAESAAGKVVVAKGGGRDLTCPECGKAFLSGKAMYGHLRSHPEKGYKGANRPATACPGACAGDDRKPAMKAPRKEARELPVAGQKKKRREEDGISTKWPVTAKRGRAVYGPSAGSAPSAAAVPSSSSSWGSEEEQAAMTLLLMASAAGFRSRVRDAKHQIPDVEEEEEEEPMPLDHHAATDQMPELLPQLMTPPGHSDACGVMVMGAHQKHTPEAGDKFVQTELTPEVITVESQTPPMVEELTKQLEIPQKAAVVVVRDKKRKTKRRVTDSEQQVPDGRAISPEAAANVKPPAAARRIPSPASDKRHECLACGKSFPTHQALGGHMSGHNKGGGGRHDTAVVQVMQNILAHRKQRSAAVIVGSSTGSVAGGAGREGAVIVGAGPVDAVTGAAHEGGVASAAGHGSSAVAAVGQERHNVQSPAAPVGQQSPAPHVCPECGMTFRSGQALGGHKRKHWYPEKHQARAAAAGSFDLNELPSDGEGGGNQQP